MARFLSDEYDYARLSFADPLRVLERAFYEQIGADSGFGSLDKEDHLENEAGVSNVTRRRVLQTLGTEWGRQCIDPDIWVKIARKRIGELNGLYDCVVIDDVRFLNEYTAIRELGGEVWNIHRPDAGNLDTYHVSEGALNGNLFDRYILNDSTVTQLLARAENALFGLSHYAGPTKAEAQARHGDIYII